MNPEKAKISRLFYAKVILREYKAVSKELGGFQKYKGVFEILPE